MSGNYPPGVTGNEFEIAGPDYEEESDELCPFIETTGDKCGKPTTELGYGASRWLVCNTEAAHQTDLPPHEPDGDRERDERIEAAEERRIADAERGD